MKLVQFGVVVRGVPGSKVPLMAYTKAQSRAQIFENLFKLRVVDILDDIGSLLHLCIMRRHCVGK